MQNKNLKGESLTNSGKSMTDELTDSRQDEPTLAQSIGLDYATMMAFTAIDLSDLKKEEKRDMIYSCLCLRCLFDNRMEVNPDPLLTKYSCLSLPEPNKLELYDLVLKLINLNTATIQLKGVWFLMFTYVLLMGAPDDEGMVERIATQLSTPEVLSEALKSRFSLSLPTAAGELLAQNYPANVVNWLLPYIDYLHAQTEEGISNLHAFLRKQLALGAHEIVFARTELLLNTYPDDEELMILNVAARCGLFPSVSGSIPDFIPSTLQLIESCVKQNLPRKVYFMYYRGLTLMAMMKLEDAKAQFADCLALDNKFMLAELMLKALSAKKS